MNTFLPYPNFAQSARCLDYKRLGKQRVETMQMLKILIGEIENSRWEHHSCTQMWKGYEWALAEYGRQMCLEWIKRGYVDNLLPFFVKVRDKWLKTRIFPKFVGNEKFHLAMKSNLIRKAPDFYRPIFGDEIPDNLPYLWKV